MSIPKWLDEVVFGLVAVTLLAIASICLRIH